MLRTRDYSALIADLIAGKCDCTCRNHSWCFFFLFFSPAMARCNRGGKPERDIRTMIIPQRYIKTRLPPSPSDWDNLHIFGSCILFIDLGIPQIGIIIFEIIRIAMGSNWCALLSLWFAIVEEISTLLLTFKTSRTVFIQIFIMYLQIIWHRTKDLLDV